MYSALWDANFIVDFPHDALKSLVYLRVMSGPNCASKGKGEIQLLYFVQSLLGPCLRLLCAEHYKSWHTAYPMENHSKFTVQSQCLLDVIVPCAISLTSPVPFYIIFCPLQMDCCFLLCSFIQWQDFRSLPRAPTCDVNNTLPQQYIFSPFPPGPPNQHVARSLHFPEMGQASEIP